MRFKELNNKKLIENKEELSRLEDKKYDLESALDRAREITKTIKYVDTPIEIMSKLGTLAEEHGLELDSYDENKVLEAKRELESAIYQLEEDFEEAIRELQNAIDMYDEDK